MALWIEIHWRWEISLESKSGLQKKVYIVKDFWVVCYQIVSNEGQACLFGYYTFGKVERTLAWVDWIYRFRVTKSLSSSQQQFNGSNMSLLMWRNVSKDILGLINYRQGERERERDDFS